MYIKSIFLGCLLAKYSEECYKVKTWKGNPKACGKQLPYSNSFLRIDENKCELFSLLPDYAVQIEVENKQIFSNNGLAIVCTPNKNDTSLLQPCSHEEADTRICISRMLSKRDIKKCLIRTVYTFGVALAVFLLFHLALLELWILFCTGQKNSDT